MPLNAILPTRALVLADAARVYVCACQDAGGETHFPLLNVSVTPRKGDALVWANIDGEGVPNKRSLHEGRPPTSGEKIAVNVWIADKAFDLRRGMESAHKAG